MLALQQLDLGVDGGGELIASPSGFVAVIGDPVAACGVLVVQVRRLEPCVC
jgi:hypothetical protein